MSGSTQVTYMYTGNYHSIYSLTHSPTIIPAIRQRAVDIEIIRMTTRCIFHVHSQTQVLQQSQNSMLWKS